MGQVPEWAWGSSRAQDYGVIAVLRLTFLFWETGSKQNTEVKGPVLPTVINAEAGN